MKNPQAFPTHPDGALINDGMTLRDYFAAKAMQSMLAHPNSKETASPQVYAGAAYQMADAMMKAREE
jgi:hypothetical protein